MHINYCTRMRLLIVGHSGSISSFSGGNAFKGGMREEPVTWHGGDRWARHREGPSTYRVNCCSSIWHYYLSILVCKSTSHHYCVVYHLSLVFFATLRYTMHSHFISCMPFEYRHAQIATTFSYLPPHLVSISTHINGCLLYPSVVNACCFREGFDKLLKLGLSITIE